MSEHALLPGSGKREASDDVDSADALERKKKKAANASSRGVANLTPEQLAKKRQNVRIALSFLALAWDFADVFACL